MTDEEARQMVVSGRAYLLQCLVNELLRTIEAGQKHHLKWIGPGIVDRAWEAIL
jgi:hypothetical protein